MDTSELQNYLLQILDNQIEVMPENKVRSANQIPKGRKVLCVETSVLFVDIRESTRMSSQIRERNMTKVYRAFASLSAAAIKEHHGQIFQFIGDGFMAAFENHGDTNSRINAFSAAKMIKSLIDTVYAPLVSDDMKFSCGYAIATGHIYMTRLKAKKYKLNSFGVFPGKATNLSSKLCALAKPNELIIDESTHQSLKTIAKWKSDTYGQEAIFKWTIT